ncbi:hypothetical protein WS87_00885 (plasmid) [Burkholderia sp. MSMB0856]|nr:hypothetical protein WS87_00885 [Burkholderia sp. MSMB0856]
MHVSAILKRAGHSVTVFDCGSVAMRTLQTDPPDAVILDLKLPDIDGLRILEWIKKNSYRLPVIVLSNAIMESEVVGALNAGADDYITKPARELELVARVQAVTRRAAAEASESIEVGEYVLATSKKTVYFRGSEFELPRIEYEIMELLAKNIGCIVSREMLVNRIWGKVIDQSTSRSLDTHIYRLRRRLGFQVDGGVALRAIYTVGYRLEYCGK